MQLAEFKLQGQPGLDAGLGLAAWESLCVLVRGAGGGAGASWTLESPGQCLFVET